MGKNLVITPGDPDGIGPEVVWKAIKKNSRVWKNFSLLCVGAREPFDRLKARVIIADPDKLTPPKESRPHVWLLEAPTTCDPRLHLGGYQSGWSIETAVGLIQSGSFSALVTGPIHKGNLNKGGFSFSGHTDFLAELSGIPASSVTMMLANKYLRTSLVTVHTSLAQVPKKLNAENISRACNQTLVALSEWWGIKKPKILVCALNPHAGEGGLFGNEEIELLFPVVLSLRKKWGSRASISDPLPADTLFANQVLMKPKDRADAVISMYHDQGLIPVKLLDFPNTVNLTLGLPFVRTSVDHGTGFDIAGKGIADHRSFQSAVNLAVKLIKKKGNKK